MMNQVGEKRGHDGGSAQRGHTGRHFHGNATVTVFAVTEDVSLSPCSQRKVNFCKSGSGVNLDQN